MINNKKTKTNKINEEDKQKFVPIYENEISLHTPCYNRDNSFVHFNLFSF